MTNETDTVYIPLEVLTRRQSANFSNCTSRASLHFQCFGDTSKHRQRDPRVSVSLSGPDSARGGEEVTCEQRRPRTDHCEGSLTNFAVIER